MGYLSWTFEEAPRLAARATREHLDGTLFDETEVEQEEPPEEEDLILHGDDDDDDAEDPESTGTALAEASTAVAEAFEPFPTVAAEVARRRTLLVSALRVRQASTPHHTTATHTTTHGDRKTRRETREDERRERREDKNPRCR